MNLDVATAAIPPESKIEKIACPVMSFSSADDQFGADIRGASNRE